MRLTEPHGADGCLRRHNKYTHALPLGSFPREYSKLEMPATGTASTSGSLRLTPRASHGVDVASIGCNLLFQEIRLCR